MVKLLIATLLMFCGFLAPNKSIQQNTTEPQISHQISVKSTESDEFLSYWREDFRKDEKGEIIPVCDITYLSFKDMYSRYSLLDEESKKIINSTPDYEEGYTIRNSIDTLIDRFKATQQVNNSNKRTLDQSSSIIVIVVIAVFGMSTICVFFVLKNGNIIQ